ncbi:MAG: B12-binding domain-containing radical SAM protein [Candidatus Omnitrophica bacterium]|nr:B12-binding domain-containing radical SAM protein [Candidatus Omnitrophota bacterium]
MKIAFINDSSERLGVASIAAVLQKAGHDVEIFIDHQFYNDENINIKWLHKIFDQKVSLISKVKSFKPDIIGFSVVSDFYQWACQIAELVKEELDVPIIFGGIHPTSAPDRVLKNNFVDMVCLGEGEYPLLDIAESMKNGELDYSIKNIWFKKDGKIIKNEMRPLIKDLDQLPMPLKDLYYSKGSHFSTSYYIMASRGCVYSCSYCCHSYLKTLYKGGGPYFRQRSVDNVVKELLIAKEKYKIKHIRFFDDSLGVNIKWLEEFSNKYSNKVNIPFMCYMHPSHTSKRSVELLKNAGCCEIEIGVQSLNESIRKTILNRHVSTADIRDSIQLIQTHGIKVVADNIVGLPNQTEKDLIEMANFYNENRVNRIYFFWLRFYPGTPITESAKQKGLLNELQYEEIMEGHITRPFSRGGDTVNKEWLSFQFLLFISQLLPKSVVRWLIKKKVYRYFHHVNSSGILSGLTTLFSSSINDRILIKRELSRYLNIFRLK